MEIEDQKEMYIPEVNQELKKRAIDASKERRYQYILDDKLIKLSVR